MHQRIYEAIKRMIAEGKDDREICSTLTRDYNVDPVEARMGVSIIRETLRAHEKMIREKPAVELEKKSEAFSSMLYWGIGLLAGIFVLVLLDEQDAHYVAGFRMANPFYYVKFILSILATVGCGVMTLVNLIRIFSRQ